MAELKAPNMTELAWNTCTMLPLSLPLSQATILAAHYHHARVGIAQPSAGTRRWKPWSLAVARRQLQQPRGPPR